MAFQPGRSGREKIVSEAVVRTKRAIAAMPFEAAMRLDDSMVMSMTARRTLEVAEELGYEGV